MVVQRWHASEQNVCVLQGARQRGRAALLAHGGAGAWQCGCMAAHRVCGRRRVRPGQGQQEASGVLTC